MTVTQQEPKRENTSKKPDNFTIHAKRNRCPKCTHDRVYVTDKRNTRAESAEHDISKRRRHCRECGHKWSTIEIHQNIWALFRRFTSSLKRNDKDIPRQKTKDASEQRAELMESIGNHVV